MNDQGVFLSRARHFADNDYSRTNVPATVELTVVTGLSNICQ